VHPGKSICSQWDSVKSKFFDLTLLQSPVTLLSLLPRRTPEPDQNQPTLKVDKRAIFWGSDFESYTFS
jgi:hypothetical protein